MMRYFTVFLFVFVISFSAWSQSTQVKGRILNELSLLPLDDVNIINITTVKGTISKQDGSFSIDAKLNDSIHFSSPGYLPIKLKVTNDWLSNNELNIYMSEQSNQLAEIFIKKYELTGVLEVDTKLIALNEQLEINWHRQQAPIYNIAFGSYFSPVDAVYNLFKGKTKELKKLEEIKEDQNMIALMQTRYDREIVCGLLNITQEDIITTLKNCNQTDRFIYTATDFQIYQALNECYENSKIMAKKLKNTSL